MKKIFIAILVLVSTVSYGQVIAPWVKPNNNYGTVANRTSAQLVQLYPGGCGNPANLTGADSAMKQPAIYFDSCAHRHWIWDPKRNSWDSVHLGAAGGSYSFTSPLLNTSGTISINGLSGFDNGKFIKSGSSSLSYANIDSGDIGGFFSKVRSLFSAGYAMLYANGQFRVDSSVLSQYYALKKELPKQTWISDNRTNNLKLAINLGLNYKDENKATVTVSTTKSLIHQMVYLNDTIFAIGRYNPNILTRFNNLEDLTNQDSLVFTGYGDCIGGMDMVYMKNKDRLYIPTTNNDCDSAFIFEANPHTLAKTIVFSRHSDYDFQSLTTDETYLYTVISANGAAPDSILKINLTTYSATVAAIPGTGGSPYVHCIRSDKTNIYASVYGKAMLYKIRISDLATIDSVALTSSQNTDDMDFSSDYVWIGNESGGSTVDRVTKTSPMSLTAVNIGVSGNSFGLFNDGFYIWDLVSGTPGTLVRINPETMEIYKKILASGENDPNEMITDGQRKFVSLYSIPSKIIRFSSPLLTYVSGGSTGTGGTVTSVASADGSVTVTNPTSTVDLAVVKSPKWTTPRTVSITGDLTYTSPSIDGTSNVTAAGTLATVNSNVGSFTNANITVNAKGLITAASNGSTVATAMPINGLTAATSSNDIDHGNNIQIWEWNTLATAYGLDLSANSTAASSNTQTVLGVLLSGANSNSSQTTYSAQFSNTHTGTSSTNVGARFIASGGTINYAAKFDRGKVSFGKVGTESGVLELNGSTSGTVTIQPAAAAGTYTLTLPTNDGNNLDVLQTDGSGNLSWVAASTGTVTSVTGTSNRITSSGGATPAIDIAATYVGQTSITTLGTIATGTWQGTSVGDTYISSAVNWNTAYTNRITSLTTTGSSGAATLISNTLNIPTYTLAGLGGISGLTTGTTSIGSGTNTKVLYNNSGTLGEYTVSGSGNVAMTTSPVFTTPNLGTPSAANLTSATGLPLTTGLTGGNWKTIYTNGSGAIVELALGSSGQVLTSNGASSAPTWQTPSGGSIVVGTTTITSGTDTRVPFNDGGVYNEDADFTWNKTTNTLRLGYGVDFAGTSGIGQTTLFGSSGLILQANASQHFYFVDNGPSGAILDLGLLGYPAYDNSYLKLHGRWIENQGADVASANNLTLGTDGNAFEITGTTQINLINNNTWTNGARIHLLFTSTPTVKNAQTTSSNNITILLSGGADFVAAAGNILTLELSEIGGTQAWREVSRSVLSSGSGLGDPGGNGIVVRTALNTTTNRTITDGTGITWTNGSGVSGNPVANIIGYDGWSNATGNTTTTSQTTIATVTPPASTRGVLEVTMIGTETSSFNKGLTGRKFVHWKSDGATVTILQIVDEEADYRETWTTASWTVTASGGNLLIRATADNTNSTDWNTHYKLKYNTYSL